MVAIILERLDDCQQRTKIKQDKQFGKGRKMLNRNYDRAVKFRSTFRAKQCTQGM